MAFKKLLNLSAPSEPYEVATKEYVDDVKKTIDERLHIIALMRIITALYVSVNISSLLVEVLLDSAGSTGFLITQSDHIKKILVKIEGGYPSI